MAESRSLFDFSLSLLFSELTKQATSAVIKPDKYDRVFCNLFKDQPELQHVRTSLNLKGKLEQLLSEEYRIRTCSIQKSSFSLDRDTTTAKHQSNCKTKLQSSKLQSI